GLRVLHPACPGAQDARYGIHRAGRRDAAGLCRPVVHDLPAAGAGRGLSAVGRDARRDHSQQALRRIGGREMTPGDVNLASYLIVAAFVFCIGFIGVLIRKNTLVIYMCLELMLVASTIALVAFSRFNGTMDGNVFVFFILTV